MSTTKLNLALSVLALAFVTTAAQADDKKTVYTGLECVPHYPQNGINGNDYIYEYYGSEIINTHLDDTDPSTGAITNYYDLGVNCGVERALFGRSSKLKSVAVVLTDGNPTSNPDPSTGVDYAHSNCHTHVEYVTGTTINVIFGNDVYAQPGTNDVYQTLNLPATVNAPNDAANYDIHCHIYGNYSVINGYTVVEKN